MNPIEAENVVVRDEPIRKLERLAIALNQAAKECSGEHAGIDSALRAAVALECPHCGIQVSGDEFFELAKLPGANETDRIKRLRRGQCAREGCEATYSQITLRKVPGVDWRTIFSQARNEEKIEAANAEGSIGSVTPHQPWHRSRYIRVGVLVGFILIALLLRQWYLGGRIPLLREPEDFRVDPAPAGQEQNR